jgi:hypothetical protein
MERASLTLIWKAATQKGLTNVSEPFFIGYPNSFAQPTFASSGRLLIHNSEPCRVNIWLVFV